MHISRVPFDTLPPDANLVDNLRNQDIATIRHTLLPRVFVTLADQPRFPFLALTASTHYEPAVLGDNYYTRPVIHNDESVRQMKLAGRAVVYPTLPRQIWDAVSRLKNRNAPPPAPAPAI